MKKPENMKPVTRSRTNLDQMDRGLGFDGLDVTEQRASQSHWATNQYSGRQDPNKTFNSGRGPTTGNDGTIKEGPRRPPTAAVPNFKAAAKSLHDGTYNAGAQVRTPGGTRDWSPAAGQNYRGNPDRINEGRGPTKGLAQ